MAIEIFIGVLGLVALITAIWVGGWVPEESTTEIPDDWNDENDDA